MHQGEEAKYKQAVEKTLCRMICKQGSGLSLLPACLDRWKEYTQQRKQWRRVLKDCEIRLAHHQDTSAKLWAFRRLQYTHDDHHKELFGTPIEALNERCVKNVEKLDELADLVERGDHELNELTEQRNELIKGQVGGQKLAFALSVANQ